jgi:hypothetical protein
MKTTRKLTRRSFLGRVAGGAVGAGAIALVGAAPAEAEEQCTDSDTGYGADPAGRGRRCGGGGCTDRDTGRGADPAGRGRRCGGGGRACTDRDTGRRADPVGRGRRCGGRRWTGVTDSDTGPSGDPANYGRGRRNCSDSDPGDPIGRGRRC